MITTILLAVALRTGPPSKSPPADTAKEIDYLKIVDDVRKEMKLGDYSRQQEYRHMLLWQTQDAYIAPTYYPSRLTPDWDWC